MYECMWLLWLPQRFPKSIWYPTVCSSPPPLPLPKDQSGPQISAQGAGIKFAWGCVAVLMFGLSPCCHLVVIYSNQVMLWCCAVEKKTVKAVKGITTWQFQFRIIKLKKSSLLGFVVIYSMITLLSWTHGGARDPFHAVTLKVKACRLKHICSFS